MSLEDNSLLPFPIFHLAGYGCTSSCREYTHLRSDDRSQPKGFIRASTKNGLVLEVKITKQFERRGIEIKIDSWQKDKTQSWMGTSSGVDKYVNGSFLRRTRSPFTMKKRLQAKGNLLRWNKENNLYRLHLCRQPYQSNNERGKTYPQFRRFLTAIATEI